MYSFASQSGLLFDLRVLFFLVDSKCMQPIHLVLLLGYIYIYMEILLLEILFICHTSYSV